MNKTKKNKGKKIVKWTLSIIFIVVLGMASIPFIFKDKIVQLVTNSINTKIDAKLSFKEAHLSLFTNFPQASISLEDVSLANNAPFLGDTLFAAKEASFAIQISELFKKADETIAVQSIETSEATINILFDEKGNNNYSIVKEIKESNNDNPKNAFSFDIQQYAVKKSILNYIDKASNNNVRLTNINHSGKGDFSNSIFNLTTNTEADFSLVVNGNIFLENVNVSLDAILEMNLETSTYTFKNNKGFVNQLPIEFQGFIQLFDTHQQYDLHFNTLTSSFKNAIALFPKKVTGDLSGIETKGEFTLEGYVKGELSAAKIPNFSVGILSKNAMFHYKSLPKAVDKIDVDIILKNDTGLMQNTILEANKLSFSIDKDRFNTKGKISNITENPKLALAASGTINLANINKVYPVTLTQKLTGNLSGAINSNFSIRDLENKKYQNIKTSGLLKLENFTYNSSAVANSFEITNTAINFTTQNIDLTSFEAKTGNSDLSIKGNLTNFYGFLFDKSDLKGSFSLKSNQLNVNDFLSKKIDTTSQNTSSLKIPSFLDITLNANANTVVYDNITLNAVSGQLKIKEETVQLNNLKSGVFGGTIGVEGSIATKEKKPTFSIDLNLNKLKISESFSTLDLLKSIAPIAKTIEGNINSTIKVSGELTDNMTPDLNSISGNFIGELNNTKVATSKSKTLNLINTKLDFIDTDQLNVNNIKGYFSFANGQVTVKPIPLQYKDIKITLSGTHSFTQSMNYYLAIDLPVKYLGSEFTKAIAKLTPKDAEAIQSIPVQVAVSGSFTNPNFSSDLKTASTNLMKTIVEKQKANLKAQGKDKIKNLLGIEKSKDSLDKDSTKTPKAIVKDKAKDLLKNLFNKKKKDSVPKKN